MSIKYDLIYYFHGIIRILIRSKFNSYLYNFREVNAKKNKQIVHLKSDYIDCMNGVLVFRILKKN